jgi:hypothetical protein
LKNQFAILGPIDDHYATSAKKLLDRLGPYKTKKSNDKIVFQLSHKMGALLDSSHWMARHNISSFKMEDYSMPLGFSQVNKTRLTESLISSIPSLLHDKEGVQWMERICRLVLNCSLLQMREVITESVARDFFNRYPRGNVKFIISTSELNLGLAALRVMGAASDLCQRDPKSFEKLGRSGMLMDLQGPGVFTPSKQMTIPVAMFLPTLYGFIANKVAFCFVFLLDQPIAETRRSFPSTALDLFRSEASRLFGESFEGELADINPEAVDRFRMIDGEFDQGDIRNFINQYQSKLNHFLKYMLDPANFMYTDTGYWIGLSHYRAWLAFERITDEVLFLLTEQAPYLRKMALFRILDQIATLATENPRNQPQVFKDLLLPPEDRDPLYEGLQSYKGRIGDILKDLLYEVRQELVEVVIGSIYLKDRVNRGKETVLLSSGKHVSFDEYVTNNIREIRNTHHGYHTKRFDDYLSISTGNTPDSFAVLGLFAYLSLIALPHHFINRRWGQSL